MVSRFSYRWLIIRTNIIHGGHRLTWKHQYCNDRFLGTSYYTGLTEHEYVPA